MSHPYDSPHAAANTAEMIYHHHGYGPIRISANKNGIQIFFPDYHTYYSSPECVDSPIFIDLSEHGSPPIVYVWSDLSKQDPTHRIDLRMAHISFAPFSKDGRDYDVTVQLPDGEEADGVLRVTLTNDGLNISEIVDGSAIHHGLIFVDDLQEFMKR